MVFRSALGRANACTYVTHRGHAQCQGVWRQGLWEPRREQRRAVRRKDAQRNEASHATVSGAGLEQLGRLALFRALSALGGLTSVLDFAEEFLVGVRGFEPPASTSRT